MLTTFCPVCPVVKCVHPECVADPLVQLRQYAKARNFEVITEFIDYASGTSEDRTQYKLMMAAAKKRKIDVVLVWRYDRFARSTQALVNALKEFQSLGINFISYQ